MSEGKILFFIVIFHYEFLFVIAFLRDGIIKDNVVTMNSLRGRQVYINKDTITF